MNEQVIDDYVTYHVKSNDHHAPEEKVGTVNVLSIMQGIVKQFNIGRVTNRVERWR